MALELGKIPEDGFALILRFAKFEGLLTESTIKMVKMRLCRLEAKKRKLRNTHLNSFLATEFEPFKCKSTIPLPAIPPNTGNSSTGKMSSSNSMPSVPAYVPVCPSTPPKSYAHPSNVPVAEPLPTPIKLMNIKKYNAGKKITAMKKKQAILSKAVLENKQCWVGLTEKLGHFNPKNVTKRENRLRKSLAEIRHKLHISNQICAVLMEKLKETLATKRKVLDKARKKRSENKSETKPKPTNDNRKKKCEPKSKVGQVTAEIREDECTCKSQKLETRDINGAFLPNVKNCVVELLAYEVSSSNVSPVVQSVLKHMAGIEIDLKQLPSKQTVVNISDAAHYLIKSEMYADRLKDCKNFGIKKDGTSRDKKKIVTSSVTLDDGTELPLGYHFVAKETGETVAEVIKDNLQDINEATAAESNTDSFFSSMIEKLSYFMSDRAANEKKADVLLREWRKEMLTKAGLKNVTYVHSFHCMAHVLLGILYHAKANFYSQHKEHLSNNIKLGREKHGRFASYRYDFAPLRCVRMTCELLGPVGDQKNGVRDKWLAHLRSEDKKCLLQTYKDNRFNAAFECSALVLHHRDDIISLIQKLHTPNGAIISLQLDLEDTRVCSMIQAFAVLYVKVTGPYWDLVTSNKVSYLDLHKYIQPLASAVEKWLLFPATILTDHTSVFPSFPPDENSPVWKQATSPPSDADFFKATLLSLLQGLKRCIELQLSDFLKQGTYSTVSEQHDVDRVAGSSLNNMSSERLLGSLDSSQKRRRHGSLHYHGSIVMLKKQKKTFSSWMNKKSTSGQQEMWKNSFKAGRKLRLKSMRWEKSQLKIQEMDLQETVCRKRKQLDNATKRAAKQLVKKAKVGRPSKKTTVSTISLPCIPDPTLNDWVAVAYENGWFPGQVIPAFEDSDKDTYLVNFLHPSSLPGQYKYPSPADVTPVNKTYIFMCPLDPPIPTSGGRIFSLPHYIDIDKKFKEFCAVKKWRC